MSNTAEGRIARIEMLVRQLDQISDPVAKQTANSLMEAILELHGLGLERMMDIVFESGDPGKATIRHLAGDDLVSSLLILHNLHPDDMETRIHRALGKTKGEAELVSLFEGVARVRLNQGNHGLKGIVETAIREAAPDLVELVIEEEHVPANDFVPLSSLGVALSRTA
jgi:hypothetical protein